MKAVKRGQFKKFTIVEVRDGAIGFAKQPSRYIGRPTDDLDGLLAAWLADPANLIPLRTRQGRMPSYTPGSIVWAALERLVYGTSKCSQVFNERGPTSRRRRAEVEAVLADDPGRMLR
ncbi:hypothetical protein [Nonomuraea sp. NPDC049709]|uniref:hypothetical protein n=1 Tax=Nonomuraea sp. NPDC049709 TaxID=3154736 RepID=UPI00341DF69E